MIISASRRTDIPTFYAEWFANRVKEGFLYVRNPIDAHQVSRIDLSPQIVDCIVFWTKNPIPMLPYLDVFDDYCYYFQFTLTGYGKDIEAHLPDKKTALIPAFVQLSERLGPERVLWRYDPIVVNDRYTADYHRRAFARIAEALRGHTQKCVISFVDIYQKNKKNLEALKVHDVIDAEQIALAKDLHDMAAANGMQIATCAEATDLSSIGIPHNACIDKILIEQLTGGTLKVKKDPSQREECLCAASVEIGAYNTCANGCRYCYANFSPDSVAENMRRYDPNSPILCDTLRPDDRITDSPRNKSLLDRQLSLFS